MTSLLTSISRSGATELALASMVFAYLGFAIGGSL